jgi:hypothetical protein
MLFLHITTGMLKINNAWEQEHYKIIVPQSGLLDIKYSMHLLP